MPDPDEVDRMIASSKAPLHTATLMRRSPQAETTFGQAPYEDGDQVEERPGPPFCPNEDASTTECPEEDDEEPSVIAAAAVSRRRHHLHETTASAFSSQQRRCPAATSESFELGMRRRRDSASSTDSYMSWSAGQPTVGDRGTKTPPSSGSFSYETWRMNHQPLLGPRCVEQGVVAACECGRSAREGWRLTQ
ncbi:hypothetical protein MRX96_041811 [Rhipicephalus microplus]